MILVLRIIFTVIVLTMIGVTGYASLHENIMQINPIVTGDPWFVATMFDAYFGFTTFFIWVCYKEKSMLARIIWFFAIMLLGNMAMAIYVLWKMRKLNNNDKLETLLIR